LPLAILAHELEGVVHSPPFVVLLSAFISQLKQLVVLFAELILDAIAFVVLQFVLFLD
jgi:hypothetical protein